MQNETTNQSTPIIISEAEFFAKIDSAVSEVRSQLDDLLAEKTTDEQEIVNTFETEVTLAVLAALGVKLVPVSGLQVVSAG